LILDNITNLKLLNKLLVNLSNLNRNNKKLLLIIFDSSMLIFILLSSFAIRLGYLYWPKDELFWLIFASPVIALPIFMVFKLYNSIIRHSGNKEISSVILAVTFYALLWGLTSYMIMVEGIPRSVILINWMLCIIIIGGSRVIASGLFVNNLYSYGLNKSNIIIYGSGLSGIELSSALKQSRRYIPVAYIDDGEVKEGIYINGVPVYPAKKISELIKKFNVKEVFLSLPFIPLNQRRKIIEKLKLLPVKVKSLPSISDFTEGKVKVDDLLQIDVRDLLGRKAIKPNEDLLKVNITGKVVLITGAGGSIGSEICRQLLSLRPNSMILFDSSESSLYLIEQELIKLNNLDIKIYPIIGSVRDSERMIQIFKYFSVQTIYHAAAYKHVPLVESNQSEGVLNNSIGTMLTAQAAIEANIETFVLISTDKAVRPTSTMGATKRVAELVLQALSKKPHNTRLTMVRFGNVLDSSGSVIPLFRRQIRQGGPITVTDSKMIRYFMTIPEAVQLVIQAGAMSKGGEVFVLDMGKPVKINDLAIKMIHLSGLQVLDDNNLDGDIEIVYTGLRSGEKLYEELLIGDNIYKTENKLIMSAKEEMIEWDILEPILNKLNESAIDNNQERIRELLIELVPSFGQKRKV